MTPTHLPHVPYPSAGASGGLPRRAVLVAAAVLLGCLDAGAFAGEAPERWSAEKANAWYDRLPWLVGCNFIPSTAVNQLEMWQAETFDADTIDRELGWAKGVGVFATKELIDLKYKQPPWSVKYPELLGILEDEPLAPKGNVVARNICWGGPWGRTQREAMPLVKFEDNLVDVDPKFAGKPPADFRLAEDSPARKIGFQPIPLDKIGVYRSDDRASWPVEHPVRSAPTDIRAAAGLQKP